MDYDLPLFGCFHNCAVMQIHKEYPLQGRRVMHSVWGAGQMAWTKCVIVVDDDMNVHDTRAVFQALVQNCEPRSDVEFVRGPLDILDHAAPALGAGTKVGFDATRKIEGERTNGPTSRAEPMSSGEAQVAIDKVKQVAGVREAAWLDGETPGWLLVSAGEQADAAGREVAGIPREVANALDTAGIRSVFVVVVGEDVDVWSLDEALFHWLANCDPGRDRLDFPGGMLFDARPKRPGVGRTGEPIREWPPLIEGTPIGPLRS